MTTTSIVDPDRFAEHLASMYREVANETGHDAHFHAGRVLAEALGYPADLLDQRPVQAVSSFAGVGSQFGLGGLVAGERALRTSDTCGAQTIELVGVKPTQETSK